VPGSQANDGNGEELRDVLLRRYGLGAEDAKSPVIKRAVSAAN